MNFKECKSLSRNWQSNPYRESSLISRLSLKGAVDLKENYYVKKINDSYDEVLPIDEGKKFSEI
ncbi:hypothetical protein [Lysinibacillus sp. NPDC056185]|uniref:hypothetical protein n=1 Tax=Lysinibacillus sp. NPDC056185 TaxID=3345739 RepID=UPI0039EF06EC